jgi:hypothetical protein
MSSWSSLARITGTSLPANMIDPFMARKDGKYHLWYKNQTTNYIEYLSSANLTTGYTQTKSGDWAGWGTPIEGGSLIHVRDGLWRLYWDEYNGIGVEGDGVFYSESDDTWDSWSPGTAIVSPLIYQHGTVLLCRRNDHLKALDRYIGTTGTASSSGGGDISIYDDGVLKSSGTTGIDFGINLNVSVSGTTSYINFSLTGTSTYFRVGSPTNLTGLTGTYWKIPEGSYSTGTLAVFVNGVAQSPTINFFEQFPSSGTFYFADMPPTGSVFMCLWGVPGIATNAIQTYLSSYIATGTYYIPKDFAAKTRVQFNRKVTDDENAVTMGSGWKFTAPRNGTYNVNASLGGQSVNELFLMGYVNDVLTRTFEAPTNVTTWKRVTANWSLRMNASDTLYFNCYYSGVSGSWVVDWTWCDITYSGFS